MSGLRKIEMEVGRPSNLLSYTRSILSSPAVIIYAPDGDTSIAFTVPR